MQRSFSHARMLSSAAAGVILGLTAFAGTAAAQTAAAAVAATVIDPGPRPLTAAQTASNAQPKSAPSLASEGFVTFDAPEQAYFNQVTSRFQEVDSVSGNIVTPFVENGSGLGPRFNANSCAGCHVYPIVGAGSPPATFTTTDQGGRSFTGNPQVTLATIDGATNTVPSFITANGPVREARFILTPQGTLDGGVHDLFTITGRSDAKGCTLTQPNFAQQLAVNNVIFRIPITVNGDGLVEIVPDGDQDTSIGLTGAANAQSALRSSLGIGGVFNRSGNDGTITKFGWKAQNKSLLMFAGEAYNVEQGVTNELFTNERDDTAGCQFNPLPEDQTNVAIQGTPSASPASDYSSDIVNFAAFARLSGPFLPVSPLNASQSAGQTVFFNIGCGACHIQSQTTASVSFANSAQTAEPAVSFQPFSDFQLHDVGVTLADGIDQGNADGQQFRSAPLWGLGQRIFFLHDGRTSNLVQVIEDHFSAATTIDGVPFFAAEANQVVNNFNALSATQQQNLLNFLRAL
jgi:CxxC motif-containing protein (DUF1111 family)